MIAVLVEHGAHAAEARAGNEGVAHVQRAAVDEHRRHRTAAAVELGLDDVSGSERIRVRLELEHVGLEKNRLEQVVDTLARPSRNVHEHVLAAPLLGNDAVLDELLAHAIGVRLGLIALVDRDHDGHAGGLRVVDRLDGLGHDAVVGSNHEHDDVGDLGAAGAHGGERLVTRGVDEGDLTAVDLDLRRTDVLGDATRFVRGDTGMADGVEKRRLAVVDVAHDGDHGRARLEVRRIVVEREGVLLLGADDLDLSAEVVGHEFNELVGHGLRHGERGAQEEQALDDVVRRHVERLGELGHGHALGDAHGVELLDRDALRLGLLHLLLLALLLRLALALLLALLATAGGLAARLLDGGTGLLENLLAAVLLGLAGHARVAVLFGMLRRTLAALTALASLFRRRNVHAGGHRRGMRGTTGVRGRRTAVVAAGGLPATPATTPVSGIVSLLGSLCLLTLLEHGLLLSDLVEKRAHARAGIRGRHRTALRLELFLLLALALQARSLGSRGTRSLLGSRGGSSLTALLLAASLGRKALSLLFACALGLLGGCRLFLGTTLLLELGSALLQHGRELLAHHLDEHVLKRR